MTDSAIATLEPAPPTPPAPAPQPRVEPFRFTGSAREYFRIWLVNLALTLVTLGIYSAWAKVRKKRYFYGNTWVAGANFEYHGNPVAILKGRVIAFLAFVAYSIAGQLSPRTAAMVLLALMPVVPLLIVRSLAFNAANSSHRHLRFGFAGKYRDALVAVGPFALVPLLTLLLPEIDQHNPQPGQLWVLFVPLLPVMAFYPWAVGKLSLLRVNHSRYGTTPFHCTARLRRFYLIYLGAAALMTILGFIFVAAITAWFAATRGAGAAWPAIVAILLLYAVGGGIFFGFTQAKLANLVLGSSTLGETVALQSKVRFERLSWIYMGNVLAIILTLGLAAPWAAVRAARYRCECLALRVDGDLGGFRAAAAPQVSATGEEMGDMFAVDISL